MSGPKRTRDLAVGVAEAPSLAHLRLLLRRERVVVTVSSSGLSISSLAHPTKPLSVHLVCADRVGAIR